MKKGIELIARFLGYDYLVLVMTTGALKYLGALLTIMITNVIGLVITPIALQYNIFLGLIWVVLWIFIVLMLRKLFNKRFKKSVS